MTSHRDSPFFVTYPSLLQKGCKDFDKDGSFISENPTHFSVLYGSWLPRAHDKKGTGFRFQAEI